MAHSGGGMGSEYWGVIYFFLLLFCHVTGLSSVLITQFVLYLREINVKLKILREKNIKNFGEKMF